MQLKSKAIGLLSVALLLSGCATDKVYHAGAGTAVYAVSGGGKRGCLAALGAGVAKEAYDSLTNGTVDGMDVVATALPCLTLLKEF